MTFGGGMKTVKVVLLLTPFSVAVIVVTPFVRAVAMPLLPLTSEIVAMLGSLLVQVTFFVTSCRLPSAKIAAAENSRVPPTGAP